MLVRAPRAKRNGAASWRSRYRDRSRMTRKVMRHPLPFGIFRAPCRGGRMLGRGPLLVLVVLAGCGQSAPAPAFDGERAMDYLRTQLAFGPRIPGTEGHRRTGDWLDRLLTAPGDTVGVQSWDRSE